MDSIKILITIIAHIIEGILGFIFFYLILLYFDIETVGYYGVLISFLEMFTFILDLGFAIAYLKIYSEINDPENKICNGTFLLIRLIQFMVYAVIIFVSTLFLPLDNFDPNVLYFFIGAYILGFIGSHTIIIILIRKKQIFKKTILVVSFSLTKIILLIILRDYYISDLSLIAMVYFISNLTFFIINLLFFKSVKINMPTKEYLKKFFEYSYPFFLITTLQIILINIDVLIVNQYVPINDVAVYFTAKKIYGYFYVIISGIGYILLTTFSKNIAMQKQEENLLMIKETHKFLNLLFVPLIFIFILYSTEFIALIFGQNYMKIGIILYILSFNIMLFLNYCAIETQLRALGKVMILAEISLLRTILTIVFMIIFISPEFINLGIIGAALAIVLAEIFTQIIIRPIIYKKYGIGYYWGSFRNLAIMLCVFLLQLYINSRFPYNILFIPLFILFNISLYFLINYLLRGFSKEDIKFFFSIVNLKKIKESILSEMK